MLKLRELLGKQGKTKDCEIKGIVTRLDGWVDIDNHDGKRPPFYAIRVPYPFPDPEKSPDEHVAAKKELYSRLEEIVAQAGYTLTPEFDGILPFCLYANGWDGYGVSGKVRSPEKYDQLGVSIIHDHINLSANGDSQGKIQDVLLKILNYISQQRKEEPSAQKTFLRSILKYATLQ